MPVFGFDENKCKVEVATKEDMNELSAEVIKKGNIYTIVWKPEGTGKELNPSEAITVYSNVEGLTPNNTAMLSMMYGNTYLMTNIYKTLNVYVKFEGNEPVLILENNTDKTIKLENTLRVVFLKYA